MDTPQFPDEETTLQEFRDWKRTGRLPYRLRKLRTPLPEVRLVTRDRVLDILRKNTNEE